ncbi:protein CFAP20DC isoform X8 [Alligator mississippiensis]|uniref:protein CFAP20DC isoform X8 n=1 Tax=Alligator mississippiensis TaxID=8496 RepID=UPI0009074CC4|nr:protein CFAP20DC isoform X8 [Alligator mississippiensis]
MFKNEYQGGPFVEIFSAQGKNPGAKWKIFGSPSAIWKEFDKEVKGFIFVLEGSSQTNKMQLPKEARQTLGLIQQFLVLQIYVPLGQDFSTELLVTDLGNTKRRLYLSTVQKELSITPLHAKIPLFMIKRKIWCNLCIDLVAFTSEIFKGAVFQSLDGIIISANCKLRKIFTLKSKPQDTAEGDEMHGLFTANEPTDVIPRACQLNLDVPQVTQLLNMTKLRQPETRFGSHPLTSSESDQLLNRGQGSIRHCKTQDVSHIAFGSKVLGPPPPSGRRLSTRASGEIKPVGSRSNRSCQQSTLEKGSELLQHAEQSELSPSPCSEPLDQGDKENIHQTNQTASQNADRHTVKLHLPQESLPDRTIHRRYWLKNTGKTPPEIINDEWLFPGSRSERSHLDPSGQLTQCATYRNLVVPLNRDVEGESKQTGEQQISHKQIFTFSSKPRSAPRGKSPSMSPERCMFPLDADETCSGLRREAQMEDDFYGTDSSEEEYDWRKYQPSGLSTSELQMLASMKRQQSEDSEDNGVPHGLSASQIDTCNISISTSSDDTTTWNSGLSPPVNQGRHYQKEMNPLSHSNPRDWLNVFSPPIIPPSQQLAGHTNLPASLGAPGEGDFSAEDDEEVLTLQYDPCLNCYFDPKTGKYYELA